MKQTWTLIIVLILSAINGSIYFTDTGHLDMISVILTIVAIIGLCIDPTEESNNEQR